MRFLSEVGVIAQVFNPNIAKFIGCEPPGDVEAYIYYSYHTKLELAYLGFCYLFNMGLQYFVIKLILVFGIFSCYTGVSILIYNPRRWNISKRIGCQLVHVSISQPDKTVGGKATKITTQVSDRYVAGYFSNCV